MIEVRHKAELADFDFELKNKSIAFYDSQSQYYFQSKIHKNPDTSYKIGHIQIAYRGATILKSEADILK